MQKLKPGDRIAVLSPAFAAPAVAPELHERALRRFVELTGLVPVEYPTTRRLDARPEDRAADVNALQAANVTINAAGFFGTFVFVPVVDGTFITQRATQALRQGRVNGVRYTYFIMQDLS